MGDRSKLTRAAVLYWNVLDLSQLTMCRPPQLVVGRVPYWRGPPSVGARYRFLFLRKEECLNSPRPFGVRSMWRNSMDWMLAAVVVLLLLGSLVSAHRAHRS